MLESHQRPCTVLCLRSHALYVSFAFRTKAFLLYNVSGKRKHILRLPSRSVKPKKLANYIKGAQSRYLELF